MCSGLRGARSAAEFGGAIHTVPCTDLDVHRRWTLTFDTSPKWTSAVALCCKCCAVLHAKRQTVCWPWQGKAAPSSVLTLYNDTDTCSARTLRLTISGHSRRTQGRAVFEVVHGLSPFVTCHMPHHSQAIGLLGANLG